MPKKSAGKIRKTVTKGNLIWDFPSTNHGKEDGFSDPAIEFFEGDHNRFIARETLQNAVDARLDYKKPVTVVFERLMIPVKSLPDSEMLLKKMEQCKEFVADQEKAELFFDAAVGMLEGAKMPVLKISDYNTVGLSGSDDDRKGNWYRLVRVTGTSSPKGVAGGSFGIGKGAPFAGSSLRAVFYSSLNERNEPVFQGVARLVSHYNEERDVRQGIGFYGVDGYKAVRKQNLIPEFFRRAERGTDIFIMGYKSDADWKAKLIKSVLYNFWLSILHGDLEVIIKDGEEIRITKDNLSEQFNEFDAADAKFYYEAATNWDQKFEQELKHLGKVLLFVRKQENYPGRVMMVRKPKMLVMEKQYRALREPYAAVFICDDERGNRLLREMEPPAHDKWDRDRAANGWAAWKEIDDFIKEQLKSMGDAVTSEPQDIPGLDKYLPDSEDRDYLPQQGAAFDPTDLEGAEESGREIGATKEQSSADIEKIIRKSIVTNKQPGGVRPTPPEGPGEGPHGRPTGPDEGGLEGARIKTSAISFRSFIQKAKDGIEYHFAITGHEDCEGGIRLVAVGDDNNYPVDVKSARDLESKKKYETDGSMIKGLAIESGKTVRLAVILESKKKYAIGIENYEG
jgi:hypothetical protein